MGTQSTQIKNYTPPPRTAMEVYEMLPEGTLAEVINNSLYMSPAPSFEHQDILSILHTKINLYVMEQDLGKCVFSPVDVFLGNDNAVQPDILYIAKNRLSIIEDGKVKSAPDLIVEVLSVNRKYDLVQKKELYEVFGVKEYFIVDPSNKVVITYYLVDGIYILQESKSGKIKSKLLKKTFIF